VSVSPFGQVEPVRWRYDRQYRQFLHRRRGDSPHGDGQQPRQNQCFLDIVCRQRWSIGPASNGGTGTLHVSGGSKIVSDNGSVGTNVRGSGLVTLTGTGTSWTMTRNLSLGNVSMGTLEVSAGPPFRRAASFSAGQQAASVR